MATRREVEHECQRLNAVRDVHTLRQSALSSFWREAGGNYLITGGTEEGRSGALCEKLFQEVEAERGPVVVLTASNELETQLIQRVKNWPWEDRIQITSTGYNNYHFFYGWTVETVAQYFLDAAAIVQNMPPQFSGYLYAFLDVLSRCYPPSLAAMTLLAGHRDEGVRQIGAGAGASQSSLDNLAGLAQEGQYFRELLRQVSSALSPLSTPGCDTRYNLVCLPPERRLVALVNLRSERSDLLQAYFAAELRQMARYRRLQVVFSDLDMRADGPLDRTARELMAWNVPIGVSTSNAALLVPRQESGFSTRVILEPDGISDGDLDAVLRPIGVYTHYEPVLSGGTPATFFPLFAPPESHGAPHPAPHRPRGRPSDPRGDQAVLAAPGPAFLVNRLEY